MPMKLTSSNNLSGSGKSAGAGNAIAALNTMGKNFTAGAIEEFNKGAEAIRDLAQNYAPVDEGHLESAIKVSEIRSKGPNVISRTIYIDADVADVGEYAIYMHEGHYELGPKSQEKANALGVPVGAKFLTRAAKKMIPEIEKAIAARMGGKPFTLTARAVKG
jgi:hypothetical protein